MDQAKFKWKTKTPFGVAGWYAPHALGGHMYRFIFPNGFCASVVQFGRPVVTSSYSIGSYGHDAGQWELAVLEILPGADRDDPRNYSLTYDTPITDDVIGWLSKDDVSRLLRQVEKLKPVDHG